jgi:hypothetical protein
VADDSLVSVSGADSLNLAGILTLGPKRRALARNRVLYRDGKPIAFLEGDSTRFLEVVEPEIESLARLPLYGPSADQTAYAIRSGVPFYISGTAPRGRPCVTACPDLNCRDSPWNDSPCPGWKDAERRTRFIRTAQRPRAACAPEIVE